MLKFSAPVRNVCAAYHFAYKVDVLLKISGLHHERMNTCKAFFGISHVSILSAHNIRFFTGDRTQIHHLAGVVFLLLFIIAHFRTVPE